MHSSQRNNNELNKPPIISNEMLEKIQTLSPSEMIIFEACGRGLATKETSNLPGRKCSVKTSETHMSHIKDKLGLHGNVALRTQAVRFVVWMEQTGKRMEQLEHAARPMTHFKIVDTTEPTVGI